MPYLKWAGGKGAILKDLLPLITNGQTWTSSSFYDLFCGAGTVAEAVAPLFKDVLLNDVNRDVAAAHRYTINHGPYFIDLAKRQFCEGLNKEKSFLAMRAAFNNTATNMEKAALFIYLNKHCYNGLCRYNRNGIFNTPYGKYKQVTFPGDKMQAFHLALHKKAVVSSADFEVMAKLAMSGDVIYCDPPYWPLTETASFTSYSAGGFTLDDQRRLAAMAEQSEARVVISNHDLPETRELYKNADQIVEIQAPRRIAANGSRGSVKELVAIYHGHGA
jgi:DNA adenine methylase